jgi:type II secretory pathway pseudopilin PulG
MSRSLARNRAAFTLFQLLVILALLSLLLAFLLPAVMKVREAAARSQCTNNLRQIALATHNINDAFQEMPLVAGPWKGVAAEPGKAPPHSLFFCLLPYIEQDNLYKAALVGTDTAYDKTIRVYVCPSDLSAARDYRHDGWLATSNYPANVLVFQQPLSQPQRYAAIPRSFPDGLSNTVMYAERYQVCGGQPCAWAYAGLSPWTAMFGYYSMGKYQLAPPPAECDPNVPQTPHAAGIPVALGDGSVRLLNRGLSPMTWWQALHPADGGVLGSDW